MTIRRDDAILDALPLTSASGSALTDLSRLLEIVMDLGRIPEPGSQARGAAVARG